MTDANRSSNQRSLDLPPVLDACCGPRMMWFDKGDSRALFIDKRRESHSIDIGTPGTIGRAPIVVDPDLIADFSALPFQDESFHMVVFDPPHIERDEAKGLLTRKYGHLRGDWRYMLHVGFAECFRVLKPHGTLIFKWAESDYPLSEILQLTPAKPLFGHRSGGFTHWCVFMKEYVEDNGCTDHGLHNCGMCNGVSTKDQDAARWRWCMRNFKLAMSLLFLATSPADAQARIDKHLWSRK